MFSILKKFNKEISALKQVGKTRSLHPLKKADIKAQVLKRINEEPIAERVLAKNINFSFKKIFYYSSVALAGIMLVSGTAFASAVSKPGDLLYSLKRAKESVQLQFAATDETKASLQADFAKERLSELKIIQAEEQLSIDVKKEPSEKLKNARVKAEIELETAEKILNSETEKLRATGQLKVLPKIEATVGAIQDQKQFDRKKNSNKDSFKQKDKKNRDSIRQPDKADKIDELKDQDKAIEPKGTNKAPSDLNAESSEEKSPDVKAQIEGEVKIDEDLKEEKGILDKVFHFRRNGR